MTRDTAKSAITEHSINQKHFELQKHEGAVVSIWLLQKCHQRIHRNKDLNHLVNRVVRYQLSAVRNPAIAAIGQECARRCLGSMPLHEMWRYINISTWLETQESFISNTCQESLQSHIPHLYGEEKVCSFKLLQ